MDVVKAYLEKIKAIPVLTFEEEKDLIRKAKKGNRDARRKIINSNLKLVVNIAKHYVYFDLPFIDLIAEGNIGLMRAINKYDPNKGYRFSTYASWWIRQAVTRAIVDQGKTIRIPVYMNEIMNRYKKVQEQLRQKLKREPSRDEVAKKLKISNEKIGEIDLWTQKKASLETPVGEYGNTELGELLTDDDIVDSHMDVDRIFDKEQISYLLDFVSEREKMVLDLRFGITDGVTHTLAEAAKILKLSRERIRQIEQKALEKLKRYATEE